MKTKLAASCLAVVALQSCTDFQAAWISQGEVSSNGADTVFDTIDIPDIVVPIDSGFQVTDTLLQVVLAMRESEDLFLELRLSAEIQGQRTAFGVLRSADTLQARFGSTGDSAISAGSQWTVMPDSVGNVRHQYQYQLSNPQALGMRVATTAATSWNLDLVLLAGEVRDSSDDLNLLETIKLWGVRDLVLTDSRDIPANGSAWAEWIVFPGDTVVGTFNAEDSVDAWLLDSTQFLASLYDGTMPTNPVWHHASDGERLLHIPTVAGRWWLVITNSSNAIRRCSLPMQARRVIPRT